MNEGLKAVAAGMNPMDLKRGIDKAVTAVVAELKSLSKPCETSKEIEQVGTNFRKLRQHCGSINLTSNGKSG